MTDGTAPMLQDKPPESDVPTDYDWQHRIAYLRLLDAAADGADWRVVAKIVLDLDPDAYPQRTETIWASHLARARWMTEQGYKHYLTSDDRR
jgi:hypothetical protein